MLMIRMRRVGAKKKPLFRVVVTESRTAADGTALEVLGHYNPAAEPETIELDRERLRHWVDRGAQLTDTVRTVVARHPEAAVPTAAEPEVVAEPEAVVEPEAVAEPAVVAEEPPAAEPAASDESETEVEAS